MTKSGNQKNQPLTLDGMIREGLYWGDNIWAETWITRWNWVSEDVRRAFLAGGGMIVKAWGRVWQLPQRGSPGWNQCLNSISMDWNLGYQSGIFGGTGKKVFSSFQLKSRPLERSDENVGKWEKSVEGDSFSQDGIWAAGLSLKMFKMWQW